jgi:hypothetical protein
MGRPRRSVLAAAIVVGAALGPGAAAASAVTDVVMLSDPGDFIGLGEAKLFTPPGAAIAARATPALGFLSVTVDGGPARDNFDFEFAAPPGALLVPGVYENAERAAFRTAGHPGIDIGGDGRGCNTDAGRFDLRDLAVKPDGTVARLWVGYEQHCEGFGPALYGEVRIGEPQEPGSGFAAPSGVTWPAVDVGAPTTVVPVSFVATESTHVTGVAVTGAQAPAFPVRLDECTGLSLSAGDVCQVFLRFAATVPGPADAVLRLTDRGGAAHVVPLHGFGIGGLTRVEFDSDPGDFIGAGVDRVFTPANAVFRHRRPG